MPKPYSQLNQNFYMSGPGTDTLKKKKNTSKWFRLTMRIENHCVEVEQETGGEKH